MTAKQHIPVEFPGPAGSLQGLYHPGIEGRPAVVLCHPHPLYGGTMRNKVVYWMARAFESIDCSVLRFNFRGVGQSDGAWDEGRGESEDAVAAINWLEQMQPQSPLWMAGFSFGCYAGLKAARCDARIERMFAVAPAVNLRSFAFMQGETRPITVVAGTDDEIVPFVHIARSVEGKGHISFHPIEGAGHFFPEHLPQMGEALLSDLKCSEEI